MNQTRVTKETYLQACNTILESDLDESGKLSALQTYASQFIIATETDMLNEFLSSAKGKQIWQ